MTTPQAAPGREPGAAPSLPPPTEGPHAPRLKRWSWAGLTVIAFSIVLLRVQPHRMGELPRALVTPVLALELAQTPAEVERVFGAGPASAEREEWRVRMVRGTQIDFGLLGAYGLFLAGVALELSRSGSRLARAGIFLAPFAACADVAENTQLLTIFGNLGGDYVGALRLLSVFTWAKWLALGAYFASIAPGTWKAGGVLRIAAVTGSAGAAATLLAIPLRGVAAEVMLNGVSIAMAALVVAAYRSK
jgi:hypothetical protein